MKMLKQIVCGAAFLGLLGGCAQPLSYEEVSKLDYGQYPSDYKRIVERYLDMTLKDPGSKQIEWFKGPGQIYNRAGPMFGGGVTAGYGVCAYVNARNSYGGYTGAKLSFFMIKDGRVILSYFASTRDATDTFLAERGCGSI